MTFCYLFLLSFVSLGHKHTRTQARTQMATVRFQFLLRILQKRTVTGFKNMSSIWALNFPVLFPFFISIKSGLAFKGITRSPCLCCVAFFFGFSICCCFIVTYRYTEKERKSAWDTQPQRVLAKVMNLMFWPAFCSHLIRSSLLRCQFCLQQMTTCSNAIARKEEKTQQSGYKLIQ